jgi:hypothetical protein
MFAPTGTYTARCSGIFYKESDGLLKALKASKSGDTVVMLENQTLKESVTVPKDVFLLLPCEDGDTGYASNGYSPSATDTNGQTGVSGTVYKTLTVDSGVNIDVYGSVLVNGVVGRKTAGHYDQDITGGYAQIDLYGDINVKSSGYFENSGFVKGSGQMTAENGSTVVDLYIVRNWRGGSQAEAITQSSIINRYKNNGNFVYPMNEIDCHYIQTTLRVESGASFQGAVRMYASSGFNYTRFPQIDNKNGLIRLNEGGYAIKTYDEAAKRSTISLYGGATFSNSSLKIVGISLSTKNYLFPIDGDIGFELNSGNYVVDEDFKLLPGCTVDVAGDASVTVNEGKTLVMYDKFDDVTITSGAPGTEYPSDRDAATLTLEGGSVLTVKDKATIAGHIVAAKGMTSSSYATVSLASTASVSATTYEANGYVVIKSQVSYVNPSTIPLSFIAKLLKSITSVDDAVTPVAGQTYYFAGNEWTTVEPTEQYTVTFNANGHGTAPDAATVNYGGTVILPEMTAVPAGYTYSYNTAADGSGTAYAAGAEITVTANMTLYAVWKQVLLGDIDGNGIVNISDLNTLLENYNKSGSNLKGDIDNNGIVNISDLNTLLENYNKSINS